MELPRALSGSNELMAWPGVASTRTVAACAGAWANATPVCAINEQIAIAVMSVRFLIAMRFVFSNLNALTMEPPSSYFPYRETRRQPVTRIFTREKSETTLPGSFTGNNSIHFADSTRKCNAKQYGRSFEEKPICVAGLFVRLPGREWSSRANNIMLSAKCRRDMESGASAHRRASFLSAKLPNACSCRLR